MSLPSLVLDLAYPRTCAGCGEPLLRDPGHICWDCRAGMQIITEPFCSLCGDPVDGMVEEEYRCSWCRRHAPCFDMARSAARYRGALCSVLQAFKYRYTTCIGRDLADLLLACVRTHFAAERFDAVTFVPLHPSKERSRTFNQSRLLAKEVAGSLGLPLFRGALRRTRPTPSQTTLSSAERRANVKGSFAATNRDWVDGRSLLLVDDIMTTGATVAECSRTLKEAGAAAVYVVTVARG